MGKKKPKPQPAKRRKTGGKKLFGKGIDPAVGAATRIKPGEVKNPTGRPKVKPILETLREVIDSDPELARRIATNALKQAAYKLGWFVEVRDMLDGKQEGGESGKSGDGVNLNLNVSFVEPSAKKN